MNVHITDVFTPSEAQLKNNIHGNINLEMISADGTVTARLSGITLRKTKTDGSFFLSMPSYEVKKGEEKKYWNHFTVFPLKVGDENKEYNNKQKDRMRLLTEEIVRLVKNGGTKRGVPATAPVAASRTPASAPAPTNKGAEPWG